MIPAPAEVAAERNSHIPPSRLASKASRARWIEVRKKNKASE